MLVINKPAGIKMIPLLGSNHIQEIVHCLIMTKMLCNVHFNLITNSMKSSSHGMPSNLNGEQKLPKPSRRHCYNTNFQVTTAESACFLLDAMAQGHRPCSSHKHALHPRVSAANAAANQVFQKTQNWIMEFGQECQDPSLQERDIRRDIHRLCHSQRPVRPEA